MMLLLVRICLVSILVHLLLVGEESLCLLRCGRMPGKPESMSLTQ